MSPNNPSIQGEEEKTFFSKLKVKCCFICLRGLKTLQSPGPACSKKSEGRQVSLKNIFSFLKFYSDTQNRDFKSNCDSMVMVSACQDCEEMIHEFSLLYQVMEETRLRLNWCLLKLHDLMTITTEKENQSVSLPTEMNNLRNETKDQIMNAVSFPRVKLRRVQLLQDSNWIPESEPTREDTPHISSGFTAAVSKSKFERSVICKKPKRVSKATVINGKRCASTKESTISKRDVPNGKKVIPTASHVSCPYCRAEFPSHNKSNGAYFGTWTLRNHLLKYHLETFFPKHKHDSISDLQFRRILGDLLFRDFMTGKACPICDWPFGIAKNKTQETNYLFNNKTHFIDAHFKELEDKLEQIQCDPDLRRDLAKVKSKGRMCKNNCGVYLGTGQAENIHLKFGCLYTKKQTVVKSKPSKDKVSFSERTKEFMNEIPENDHASTSAEAMPVKVKLEVDIENEFPAKRIKLEPNDDIHPPEPDADNWLPDSESSSSDASESSSTDSDSESVLTSTSNPCSSIRRKGARTNTRKKSKLVDKSPLACPYCRAKFIHTGRADSDNRATRLRLHHLNYHCEHFFSNLRLPSVTDAQYKKLLAELLFQSFIAEEDRSCQLCSKSFGEPSAHLTKGKDLSRRKLHYLMDHIKELEEKLQEIQQDPELPKKLEECNPIGRMCKNDCGVYIADSHKERAHDNYHCSRSTLTSKQKYVKQLDSRPGTGTGQDDDQGKMAPDADMHKQYASLRDLRSYPYCNFKCKPQGTKSDPETLFRHVARNHSEHFLLDQIQINDSPESEIRRLRRICEDILFPELMPGVGDKCIFCNKVFNCHTAKDNRYALKTHLVQQHEAEVKERLKLIQQDPNLEWRLNGFQGEFCRCGMYFPSIETRKKLMYHKRYMCKYLPSSKGKEDDNGAISNEGNVVKMEIE